MSVTYQIIQNVEGHLIAHDVKPENLHAFCNVRGWSLVKLSNNPRLRAELQNQPVFSGLCGPMYGGPGVVRYEDAAAYKTLSA